MVNPSFTGEGMARRREQLTVQSSLPASLCLEVDPVVRGSYIKVTNVIPWAFCKIASLERLKSDLV